MLLGLALAAAGLVIGGPLMPIPMLGLIGLPIAAAAALAYAVLALCLGGFEVSWWRQLVGLGLGVVGLGVAGWAYLQGLGTVAEHFLGRAGAPPLSDLWGSAVYLFAGASAIAGSVVARRARDGVGPALAAAVITGLTGALGWGLIVVLGILGAPFGA